MSQDFSEHFYKSSDGLVLYARSYGAAGSTGTVVCLPGLTRNSRDFHDLALYLATAHGMRVVTLDYRGRGMSEWDDNKANYNLMIEMGDVITACETLSIDKAHFIGTSRGGLILHLLIGARPDLISSVTFNDIGPELGLEGLRHIQGYLTKARSPAKSWEEAVAYLKEDHGSDFPALSEKDWLDMATAIYAEAESGLIEADCDPAIGQQFAALDLSKAAPDLWTQFDAFSGMPMLVVRGENSKLLTADTLAQMAVRHSGMTAVIAKGQGHAPVLHLEGMGERIGAFIGES